MDRRAFLGTFALLAAPLATEAQQAPKMPQIGFLVTNPLSGLSAQINAFRQGLRRLGLPGRPERHDRVTDRQRGSTTSSPNLAAELVRQRVDVIVTAGPPAPQAARKATRIIPIVFGSWVIRWPLASSPA